MAKQSNEVRKALKSVAAALTASLKAAIAEINLDGSGLQNSIESKASNGDTVTAYMIEYGLYVISGRRKFAKKVPIAALLDWLQRKGIQSDNPKMSMNSLAFAIQNSIFKNGIVGRDFITPAVDDSFLEIAEEFILDALEKEMEAALGQVVT